MLRILVPFAALRRPLRPTLNINWNSTFMINKSVNPVEWAGLMYELEDAHEHLAHLIADIEKNPEFDEVDFQVQLAHVFSHLNRAWHRRAIVGELSEEKWEAASFFPTDLSPI